MAEKRANSGLSALSKREAETLSWVAKGKTNSEIGLLLGITEKTVEKHLENVYRKLGVENRIMAARQVLRSNDEGTTSPS
jgi:DNA-binding CsgD family transcriptional regulator